MSLSAGADVSLRFSQSSAADTRVPPFTPTITLYRSAVCERRVYRLGLKVLNKACLKCWESVLMQVGKDCASGASQFPNPRKRFRRMKLNSNFISANQVLKSLYYPTLKNLLSIRPLALLHANHFLNTKSGSYFLFHCSQPRIICTKDSARFLITHISTIEICPLSNNFFLEFSL